MFPAHFALALRRPVGLLFCSTSFASPVVRCSLGQLLLCPAATSRFRVGSNAHFSSPPPASPSILIRGLHTEGQQADSVAMRGMLIREKDARLAEKDKEMAARLADKDARLADKDARLADKDTHFAREMEFHNKELDVARGRVTTRAGLEAAIERLSVEASIPLSMSTTAALKMLLDGRTCPGLTNLFAVGASENALKKAQLVADGKDLYNTLSKPLHTTHVGHALDAVQVKSIDGGTSSLLAYALIMSASHRNVTLYDGAVAFKDLKIRSSPPSILKASEQDFRNMPFQH
jgi:hypothetical protein